MKTTRLVATALLGLTLLGGAAQAAGYNYTPALRQSDLRWDDATLKRWIRDPAALVPGTSMAYSNSLGEADIEALLVFLKSEGL